MNTSRGWARAQLELRGIDAEYNSLREAYLISAIRKENRIEMKKNLAMMTQSGDKKKENFREYLEEMFPEVAEKREDFVENNKTILKDLAGNEIDLSKYKRMDN